MANKVVNHGIGMGQLMTVTYGRILSQDEVLALYDFEKTGTSRPTAKISFTLTEGLGDTDNAVFTIEGNQLKTAQLLNYDASAVSV